MNKKGYKIIPLGANRKVVNASLAVTGQKHAIHAFTETDISLPRAKIAEFFSKTGQKISLTAFIVCCLAQTLQKHPNLNSFIKGNKLVVMDDVTVSVLVERNMAGWKTPEPVAIQQAQLKDCLRITSEIRAAQAERNDQIGSLQGMEWVRFIPKFLFKAFVRLADRSITMGLKYGKVAVTAVGMFTREPVWFVPHGPATVLITVGSIYNKVVEENGQFASKEHLRLTFTFDHAIVDGAPAARFIDDFAENLRSGAGLPDG